MSAFALKREYALQCTNNYADIDRDQMEYVDGWGSAYKVGIDTASTI